MRQSIDEESTGVFNLQAKEARELVKNEQKNGEESADRKGKGSSS